MGSTHNYTQTVLSRIDSQLDSGLVVTLRILVYVFLALITCIAFVFAVAVAVISGSVILLRVAIRWVIYRPEAQKVFALAA